jgi:hypothetical protein
MPIFDFDKIYAFEGKDYTRLDFAGAETLTARCLTDAQAALAAREMNVPVESSVSFWVAVLGKISGQCPEFFEFMPDNLFERARDAALENLLNSAADPQPIPPEAFTAKKIAAAQSMLGYGELLLLQRANSLKYALAVYASLTGQTLEDMFKLSAGAALKIFFLVRRHFFGLDSRD